MRGGGSSGSISFSYSVVYIPPGGTPADGSSSFLQTSPSAVVFAAGVSTASVVLDLQPTAVLEVGAVVSATITSVQLTSSEYALGGQCQEIVMTFNPMPFLIIL